MMARGPKSKYNPKYHVPWVRGLARQGLTVAEIAKEIGVAKSTLCLWVKKDPVLSDALNEGRQVADCIVADSLFNRARGVKVTEKRTIVQMDATGLAQPARTEVVEKELPPDTTACIFWLKNRDPQKWRDHPVKLEVDNRPIIVNDVPVGKIEDGEG